MNDYVTKPIDRKALVTTLRRWVPVSRVSPPVSTQDPDRTTSMSAASVSQATPEPALRLDGIDVDGTVRRLGIEPSALERMLVRFAAGKDEMLEPLRAAVRAGDSAAAARHAHALAGASGNLGADDLRAAAKALELAGRDGRTDLEGLLEAVDERARIVFTSIEVLDPVAPAPAGTSDGPFDRTGAEAALDRLTLALGDGDLSAAADALDDLTTSGVAAWAGADFGRLRRAVDEYEFDEATAIASSLRTRVRTDAADEITRRIRS
jgi:two-component system, sensor histidine kinase and response regulator